MTRKPWDAKNPNIGRDFEDWTGSYEGVRGARPRTREGGQAHWTEADRNRGWRITAAHERLPGESDEQWDRRKATWGRANVRYAGPNRYGQTTDYDSDGNIRHTLTQTVRAPRRGEGRTTQNEAMMTRQLRDAHRRHSYENAVRSSREYRYDEDGNRVLANEVYFDPAGSDRNTRFHGGTGRHLQGAEPERALDPRAPRWHPKEARWGPGRPVFERAEMSPEAEADAVRRALGLIERQAEAERLRAYQQALAEVYTRPGGGLVR